VNDHSHYYTAAVDPGSTVFFRSVFAVRAAPFARSSGLITIELVVQLSTMGKDE